MTFTIYRSSATILETEGVVEINTIDDLIALQKNIINMN